MRYVAAPGHTPGQSAIRFDCDGEGVLFAGDSMHHPIQIAIAEWSIVWDEDYEQSKKSRLRILEMAADERLILALAHFTYHACRVTRTDRGFRAVNLEMADTHLT